MSSFLSQLEWRHATKSFDSSKKISEGNLIKILTSIRMAPTSFGLQPFHVEVIKNEELKQKLQPHAWYQKQIVTCSHLLVFVAHSDIENRIEEYFTLLSGGNADERAKLKDYEGMMKGTLAPLTTEEKKIWAQKQAYIALGFAIAACAELSVDSCPMEGFLPGEFDKQLNLKPNEFTSVILAVGFRDPAISSLPKTRFPEKDLFHYK